MKYKSHVIPFLIAVGHLLAFAESQFYNIPLPAVESSNAIIADNTKQCWCPCQCPIPPPTPPTSSPPHTTPTPIPHPPLCNKVDSTIAVSLSTSCNNCPNPDCSTSPNGSTFPYANHCQFYWMCENGIPTICYCPNGFWFDRERHVCDYCPNVRNCPANTD